MTTSNNSEIIALCLLVDCDGVAPYIACREDSDEPQLYDVDYDAMYDVQDYEARGLKSRIIPILRHRSRHGLDFVTTGDCAVAPAGFNEIKDDEPAYAPWCSRVDAWSRLRPRREEPRRLR